MVAHPEALGAAPVETTTPVDTTATDSAVEPAATAPAAPAVSVIGTTTTPTGSIAVVGPDATPPGPTALPPAQPEVEAAPYGPDDCLERLWVPHRMLYIDGLGKPEDSSIGACPFCDPVIRGNDVAALRAKLVVARGKYCYAILNLFPYNSGHLLVLPYRHVAGYIELDDDETAGFTALTKQAIEAQAAAMHPQGFNIGMNQGEVAGAGIASHLHQHVVPRWQGDANFLPIVGQTKAMPQFLANTREQLAGAWPGGDPLGGEPVL